MGIEITERVKIILYEILNLDKNIEIVPSSQLKNDLGLDSMSSLTFLMALEENIQGFIVNPDTLEMTDLQTVATITHYIMRELSKTISVTYA